MKFLFLIAFAHASQADCEYWLIKLNDIGLWETMRINDVPKTRESEGNHSAMELDIDLRFRIREIMQQIRDEERR